MKPDHLIIPVILMGGFSSRMKKDKSFLKYQNQYWYQIIEKKLLSFFPEVYLSLRKEQFLKYQNILKQKERYIIFDHEWKKVKGPLKGILSVYDVFKFRNKLYSFFLFLQI